MGNDEVSGEFRVRGDEAGRESKRAPDVDPNQLQMLLTEMQAQLETLAGQSKPEARPTFGELALEWRKSTPRVWPAKEANRYELLRPLFDKREGELTPKVAKDFLTRLRKPIGPYAASYTNKIRTTGKLIIAEAQLGGIWKGLNPFAVVKRAREPRKEKQTVTIEEARAFLPRLREDRRWLALTMLFTGMRPGEMLGLHKASVNLVRKEIKVWRSHARDETKTGEERTIFIPDQLIPVLAEAMAKSPSQTFVFGHPNGGQWGEGTNLSRALQHAFRKAGMCTGYEYSCRRKGCRYRDKIEGVKEERRCPVCGFKLWAWGIPRKIWFYSLRHSCATLHRLAGADPLAIKVALGHARVDPTDDVYTHLTPAFQRAQLNKLKLLPEPEDDGGGGGARPPRLELGTPGLEGRCSIQMSYGRSEEKDLTTESNGSLLARVKSHVNEEPSMQAERRATKSSRTRGGRPSKPSVACSGPYLTAKQAAELFQVTPDYIRLLCRKGGLPHARFGQHIRITSDDLHAFMAEGGRPGPTVGDSDA